LASCFAKKESAECENFKNTVLISDKPFLSEVRFVSYVGDEAGHYVAVRSSYFGSSNMQTLLHT